jgi:hypothetical protein
VNPSFIQCNIAVAQAALSCCIPGGSLLPDRIFEIAKELDPHLHFQRIPDSENLSKLQLFDLIFLDRTISPSRVFVIADGLLPGSAYTLEGWKLREAVLTDELFLFDGDVLFIWPEVAMMTVYHHEGGYFHVAPPHGASLRSTPG